MQRHITMVLSLLVILEVHKTSLALAQINRTSFPSGFVFGTASSAFQYEGAVKDDGRGPSIWDTFSHIFGKILYFSNADVAVDQYHRFQDDVQLMKDMGYNIGQAELRCDCEDGSGEINQAGVDHYNKLIDALLVQGIEPYVTLYHWDLPQTLEDKYNGWLDRQIVTDFAVYSEMYFQKFGDRVKHWIMFNEPHTFAVQGYDVGLQAPGRCSVLLHLFCRAGNSSTEPYIVAHNMLLSHANVADIYKKKYKANQHGSIGISLDVIWFEPGTNATVDIEAAKRGQDFQLGWFLDPLVFGDYPSSMRSRVKSRLPTFTESESSLIKGSCDFIGINHYTTFYAWNNATNVLGVDTLSDSATSSFRKSSFHFLGFCQSSTDLIQKLLGLATFKNGKAIGDRANSIWLYIVPQWKRSLMNYIKQNYGNPTIIITENGMDDLNSPFISIKDTLNDDKRIGYHRDYLTSLLASIREDGCNVKGYFVWSLLDNWEWAAGYTSRFGLYFVDYNDSLKRYSKNSVQWFKNFLASF